MFSKINSIYDLSTVMYYLDRYVREDLSQGFVVNERDYVSNLTAYLRLIFRQNMLASFCYTQTLPDNQEETFGCDSLIVIKTRKEAKIGLFEAKRLRPNKTVKNPHALEPWDQLATDKIKNKKISHFKSQLERQSKWSHVAAIWELFALQFDQGFQPPGFDDYGSTCIWHEVAYNKAVDMDDSTTWKKKDLMDIVWDLKTNDKSQDSLNIAQIIRSILLCKKGEKIDIENGFVAMQSQDERSELIPVSRDAIVENLDDFQRRTGIQNFIQFEYIDPLLFDLF